MDMTWKKLIRTNSKWTTPVLARPIKPSIKRNRERVAKCHCRSLPLIDSEEESDGTE